MEEESATITKHHLDIITWTTLKSRQIDAQLSDNAKMHKIKANQKVWKKEGGCDSFQNYCKTMTAAVLCGTMCCFVSIAFLTCQSCPSPWRTPPAPWRPCPALRAQRGAPGRSGGGPRAPAGQPPTRRMGRRSWSGKFFSLVNIVVALYNKVVWTAQNWSWGDTHLGKSMEVTLGKRNTVFASIKSKKNRVFLNSTEIVAGRCAKSSRTTSSMLCFFSLLM